MSGESHDDRRRRRLRDWAVGVATAALMFAGLFLGVRYGSLRGHALRPHVVAWLAALAVLVSGVLSVRLLARALRHSVSATAEPAAGAAAGLVAQSVGYVVVILAIFGALGVSLEHLAIGVGLAGVVLGIAAQQSLGNIFAALVLLVSHPFKVGDRIRVRSGVVGVLDVTVQAIGLTYVTVRTEDGVLKIPNSAMLAAGIGQLGPEPPSVESAGPSPD